MESDVFGNTKHVVNIQTQFDMLEVTSRSTVARSCADPLPDSVGIEAWDEIRSWQGSFKHWEFLKPSAFARPSDALASFVDEAGIKPKDGPLQTLRRLSEALHDNFQYVPGTTSAISPIEHILEWRQGVCQDYAHVMITVARGWGIPARYVSGYLYVKWQDYDEAPKAASHAWVECLLPSLGWVGFDPTNRCLADERHIRVGIGPRLPRRCTHPRHLHRWGRFRTRGRSTSAQSYSLGTVTIVPHSCSVSTPLLPSPITETRCRWCQANHE